MTRATAPAARALPVVAHCCTPYLFATGSWLYSQLVHLERHEPIVLTDRTENLDIFPFREVYAYNEINRLRQALFYLRRTGADGGRGPFFESVLRRRRARLIHSHFGYVGWRMLDVKRRLGLPMATSFYGADASRLPRDPMWRSRYEQLFAHGELFLAEGEAMRSTLAELGCPPERIEVQHLGVAVDELPCMVRRRDPSGPIRVLVAATFREKKGVPDALRAVGRLQKHHRDLRVTLIGDSMGMPGDEEEKRTILDLVGQLEGVVRWVGFQPYPAFVVDGSTGYLSPERDVEALAANLDRLITAPAQVWEAMGSAARAHVEKHYNVRTQGARLEGVYERLASRNHG